MQARRLSRSCREVPKDILKDAPGAVIFELIIGIDPATRGERARGAVGVGDVNLNILARLNARHA